VRKDSSILRFANVSGVCDREAGQASHQCGGGRFVRKRFLSRPRSRPDAPFTRGLYAPSSLLLYGKYIFSSVPVSQINMPKTGTGQLPKNWPPNIPYLSAPRYSQTPPAVLLSAIQTRSKDSQDLPQNTPKGPCPLVKITHISSLPHPAYGQSGLFAMRDLKPGSFIIRYLGEIHISSIYTGSEVDPHANSDYDLSLDREHGIGIDADRCGNEARFINDYRGIAEKPNAEFKEIWDEERKARGMGVWVLGDGKMGKGKGLRKGEEIVVSYGRGFWGARKSGDDTLRHG
jgi:hypothetical protein